ncbi:MAG: 3,4-dihydroxy-2-butanone-4-phosphate synthase, partial [Lentisphaeria bacterium]|nr:3,4-dihydroxy-2-butanone-4-phosphate synthase [Lentisphaeria bacterium]
MFAPVEELIEEIRNGRMIIVVDDESRENEGDLIAAAAFATPDVINFMITHGRGLVCVPLEESRTKELGLFVTGQRDSMGTAFTQ